MLASNLTALAPLLSAQSSSSSTSCYIQKRTALFALVAFVSSSAGLAIQIIAEWIRGGAGVWSQVNAWFLFSSLVMMGLWLFARGGARDLRLVRSVEVVSVSLGMFTASLGLRVSSPALVTSAAVYCRSNPLLAGADPGLLRLVLELTGMMTALLVATQVLALRAALVPSTLRHSLGLAAFSVLPSIFAVGLGWPAILPTEAPLAPEERGFLLTFGVNWWVFTAVVCAVIARIVHRLEAEVKVARRLGQYEVGEKLGEGGMGVVFRARHALMKRPVALKLLPPEAAGQDAIARFEREVLLTSQLNHPNTVVIHDYGHTHDGVFYYVMELIEGATLEQVVEATGPMPSGRVVHVLRMVAGALAEAHERGLVHRDIKPANLLIGPRGGEPDVVKVLDFGLVRPVTAEVAVTCAGVILGTPLFMSPEAIRNSAGVDARSDLYSLGSVAYYLVSGRPVFEAESAMEVCASHLHEPPAPLRAQVPDLDPELDRLVLACLAKDPAQRPASARDLLERLERCPSAAEWTRSRAQAWWAEHQFLLRVHSPASNSLSPTVTATRLSQRAAG